MLTAGTVYYIATDGNDNNDGTEQAPFLTLEKARDTIRELKDDEGLPDGGVTVYLREGRYERPLSFDLEEQDSGEVDKPIVYAAYPGEEEVFNQIPGFPNIPFAEMGTDGQVGTGLEPTSHPVTGVVAYDDEITIGRWKTAKLRTAVLPWNADNRSLTYASADPAIATVDAAGIITGGAAVGQTTITIASAENPALTAVVDVTVEEGDGVMDRTDFETGMNGWPQDSNRTLEKIDGNRWYKILNGASALSAKSFSEYELTFRIKTPETLPDELTLYVFDRQSGSNSTRIGYRSRADGTSSWLLYNTAWAINKEEKMPTRDLQPDTEYQVKVIVVGSHISVEVDGVEKLTGIAPNHRPVGKVGFYVSGFAHLLFDNVKFSIVP